MEDIKFTDEDITLFLKKQIEATGDFKVDDGPDRFVRMMTGSEEGEVKTLSDSSGVPHPIAIFGTVNPDAIIINPLAEGSSNSSKQTWWYATCNACLAGMVYQLMQYLITASEKANVKPKKGEKELPINTAVIELVGEAAVNIDAKTSKELTSIVGKDLNSFFGIHYDKSTKTSNVKCTILNEAQRKAHSSIRAKTWKALEHLLYSLLGTKDISELSYKATILTVPVFESFSNVQLNVLKKLAPHAKLIDKEIKDLGSLASCVKYIEQYHNRAKWQISTPVPDEQPESVAPWVKPSIGITPVIGNTVANTSPAWKISPVIGTTTIATTTTTIKPCIGGSGQVTPNMPWSR